jgi:hypothetical protein
MTPEELKRMREYLGKVIQCGYHELCACCDETKERLEAAMALIDPDHRWDEHGQLLYDPGYLSEDEPPSAYFGPYKERE